MTNSLCANARRSALLGVSLIVLCAAIGSGASVATMRQAEPGKPAQAEWARYMVQGEEFSAQLPLTPAMTTREVIFSSAGKTRLERTLGAYADGVGYVIYTIENPKPGKSLEDLIQEFYNKVHPGEFQNGVRKDGFTGKEYAFSKDDLRSLTHFYLTSDHFYIFRVVGSTLRDAESRMKKFLNSIKFEKQPVGQGVVDGNGEQPQGQEPAITTADAFSPRSVDRKAFVLTHPEPKYTEEARKNQVEGTVILRCILSSSGTVTNVIAISKLPDGLTQRALEISKQLKFIPAVKDGHFVSMYVQMEYNFNLY